MFFCGVDYCTVTFQVPAEYCTVRTIEIAFQYGANDATIADGANSVGLLSSSHNTVEFVMTSIEKNEAHRL